MWITSYKTLLWISFQNLRWLLNLKLSTLGSSVSMHSNCAPNRHILYKSHLFNGIDIMMLNCSMLPLSTIFTKNWKKAAGFCSIGWGWIASMNWMIFKFKNWWKINIKYFCDVLIVAWCCDSVRCGSIHWWLVTRLPWHLVPGT